MTKNLDDLFAEIDKGIEAHRAFVATLADDVQGDVTAFIEAWDVELGTKREARDQARASEPTAADVRQGVQDAAESFLTQPAIGVVAVGEFSVDQAA